MQSATSTTIWDLLTRQATRLAQAEPALEPVVADSVLGRSSFADALAHRLFAGHANVRNVRSFFSVLRSKFEPRITVT